ncbi:MAG TPA: peroxiredoxin [Pirellulales bacterium]|jgi:peroxiredoxin Q/BCP|nr:peroxiredoxin [Pirellulales bacterium]
MRSIVSLAALGAVLVIASNAGAAELKVGDPAPNFSMQGTDGKTYKLSDFKGKEAVVIAWFPKADTPGCTKECKSMKDFGSELRKYDVAYFTASVDNLADNQAFAKKLGLDYPILCDPTKENANAFGVLGSRGVASRWTYYISKDGKIAAIDKEVKTDSHGKDVAAKLADLGIAKKS